MSSDDMPMSTPDDDEVTVASGSRTAGNGPVEAEILVRFQLPPRSTMTQAKLLQCQVLLTILKAFPNDITYVDNKNEEFVYTEQSEDITVLNKLKKSSMSAHAVNSKTKKQDGNRWVVILKFRTTIPFRDWKKHDELITKLRQEKIYMTPHRFEHHQWDVISLGFLLGIHVVQFPLEAAKEHLLRLIEHSAPNPPGFALQPAKVQLRGKPTYTRAYEVVCPRAHGQQLYKLLTHGKFREPQHRIFVPYSLKRDNASTFQNMLKENNQMLGDSYVLKFQGIPKAGIATIESRILAIPGARFVVPTSKTQSQGEWRVLIKSSKFASVNGYIRQNWADWCKEIPFDSFIDVPDSFPAPTITSKNVRNSEDEDDGSADSYGTLLSSASTITAESLGDDDQFDSCPLDDLNPTYAQVATGNSSWSSPASTITPSGVTPQYAFAAPADSSNINDSQWQEENRILQQKLRDQDERIQELDKAKSLLDQRLEQILEEVQNKECRARELEDAIANLLTVVSDRDKQMAERDQQFEIRNQQFDALMAKLDLQEVVPTTRPREVVVPFPPTISTMPATPARSNKRQNTLSTPSRGNDVIMANPDIEMITTLTDDDLEHNWSIDTDTGDAPTDRAWEDNDQHVGNIMEEHKPPGTVRIYCINVNGLKWDEYGGNWPNICDAMEACNADIVGLVELNQDVGRYNILRQMDKVCKATFTHHQLIMSTSSHKSSKTYKPGGTAVLACNDMQALVKSWSRDRMGRWTAIRFSGSDGTDFMFIIAYQVCKSTSKGTNTAAAQQRATIIEESTAANSLDRETPRKAFIRELQSFVKAAQQAGNSIILCGDFNETMSDTDSGMANLARTCGLIDLFSIRLDDDTRPATYQRGHRRLDYVLMSANLLPAVTAAGYDPFGYRIVSDHRGYFLDFDASLLCGLSPIKLAGKKHRDFYSSDPRQLRTYLLTKEQYLCRHNWYARIKELLDNTEPNPEKAESLDRDMERASFTAANACKFSHRSSWSPKFAQAWAQVNFYKLARSQIVNNRNYSAAIRRLQQHYPTLPEIIPDDPLIISARYREAVSSLRATRQDARRLRNEFLERRATMYENLEEQGKAHIVRRILRAETMSKVYRKIKFIREANKPNGLSTIKVPRNPNIRDPARMKELADNAENWRTVRVPSEIERLILERNRFHFGQAEGTPFTQPPLSMDVRYNGTGIQADSILQGSYDATMLSAPTALFIQHLQQKSLRQLEGQITVNDVLEKLKNWPERTTTSPSGLHLGHYHAMWRPTGCRGGLDDPEGQAILNAQQNLQKAHTMLLQYALKHGYSYKRWSSVVNVMLEKDVGNPRIHRLRVIHLYEADYNLILAVKWREALYHAEDSRILNQGLYGSRPGRSAIIPVQIEIMQNAIYQLSMKSGINFDLDASSCYDRILAKVASISSRRMGMNSNVVLVNCNTLEQAKFRIKTTIGVSESWYTHSEAFPIHGTGQGSGNSPTIWCFVCSALFDALESQAQGALFISPNRSHSVRLCMIGFVDDCSQRINRFEEHPQPSAATLINYMQKEAQLWNDLLWASGGELEQSKCSFHLIQSSWSDNGVPFFQPETNAPPLILVNHNGNQSQISQMSNYTAHRTLGCYIEPAMTMIKQMQVLQHKNNNFASLLKTNFLSRAEAWTMYTSVYLPSMTYPFPNIVLTETDGAKLDQKFMPALVPRCGYNQKMATAIRYGPRQYGGAGFRQLHVEWGSAVIIELLRSLRTPTSYQGKMTIIALSWAQHYIGTSVFLLEDPTAVVPPCPNRYIMAIRQFLAKIKGKVILQERIAAKLLRAQDRFIMDLAVQHRWSKHRLDAINACRRYLQATTVADIANEMGTKIEDDAWMGTREVNQTTYQGIMFNQQRPNQAAWKHWRTFLRTLCDTNRKLLVPLGSWIVPASDTRHPPHWIYDPVEDQLYQWNAGLTYKVCQRLAPRLFSSQILSDASQGAVPGFPTWVQHTARGTYPMHAYQDPLILSPPRSTFTQYVQSLAKWEKELLTHHVLNYNPVEIMTKLNQGPITCASDGSVRMPYGTFGYVISDSTEEQLIKGHGPAPGAFPNSLRSEAYGNLATCRMLFRLSQYTGISLVTSVTHFIDNKALIRRATQASATQHDNPSLCIKPEWDVINEITHSTALLQVPTTYLWVKSHQDDNNAYNQLSHGAQMNCSADQLAATFYHHLYHQHPVTLEPALPSNPVQFVISEASITRQYRDNIRTAATLPALQQYVCKRFSWTQQDAENVAWDSFYQITQGFQSQRTTVVKHIHSIAPTGHIAHRNCPLLDAKCPSCGWEVEDNTHVITCPAASREDWRATTIATLNTIKQHYSDPLLKQIMVTGLLSVHQGQPGVHQGDYPDCYHQLIQQQNQIGWEQLYKGRWSQLWSPQHQCYGHSQFHWSSQEKDGNNWVVAHGKHLLNRWLQLWQLRNEERHGADQEARQRHRHTLLMNQLQDLYTLKDKVAPRDRNLFYANATQHIATRPNLDLLEDWILTHRTAITASAKQAELHGIRRNHSILDYFPRQQHVTPRANPANTTGNTP